jgi:hypothetical protein
MKSYRLFILYSLMLATVSISCEEDYESNAANEALLLTVPDKNIKASGQGQYRFQVESGYEASVTANVASARLKSLTVTKTVNLAKDEGFGAEGVMAVDLSSFSEAYVFNYMPLTTEVDQLVGFTFTAEMKDGSVLVSDLNLVVTLSPKDNISRRKWLFTSKIWVDNGNAQDIKECEKDNYSYFNADGRMSIDFGALTNVSGCDFDWANIYDKWELSEDEKTFTIYHHAWNTPDIIVAEAYRVKTFTTEKLELEIDIDLSWLGLSTEETFIYQYTAQAK